jgi:HlyD family secretion protein
MIGGVVAVIAPRRIWYLVPPQPLLVQGEVDATAFRHCGVRRRSRCGGPVEHDQDVTAGAVLVRCF